MNKKTFLILPFILLLPCGCQNSFSVLTNENAPFISEIYTQSNVFESAIEITNKDKIDEDIYLSFYKEKTLLLEINLKEYFKDSTNKSIVFKNPSLLKEFENVETYTLESDVIYGFNYIEIKNSKNVVFDSVGTLGFNSTYIESGSLIKNENSLFATKEFSSLNWYKVSEGITKYLGNLNTPMNYDKFIKGPELMESYYNSDFIKDGKPNGGVYETSVSNYGDGDTTNFTFSDIKELGDVERTRYYLVNCPEIDHTQEGGKIEEEPWGNYAKDYTNNILKKSKHILIQSALGGSLRETYGRLLGFVWYTYEENPKASDYKLLNYELVYNGLGKFMTGSTLDEMISNEVPYYYYFNYANDYAVSKGLKMWGEIDPNFNY